MLCALGLAGPVFALIEQPARGWDDPLILAALVGGLALLALFVLWEARWARAPMLPLGLFRSRNFAVGNGATFAVYAGLGAATFFVALFLQEVAGYSALAGGLALLPLTLMMLTFARRFGALAGRLGPRLFMGLGPLVCSAGLLLWLSLDEQGTYVTQVLPGAVVFGLGLAMTVAPLTATVLGAVAAERAGVASGVNNAIARVASLLAIAIVGAVVTAVLRDRGGRGRDAGSARATSRRRSRRSTRGCVCAAVLVGARRASCRWWGSGTRPRPSAPRRGQHLTGDPIVTFVTVPSANTGMVPIARLRASARRCSIRERESGWIGRSSMPAASPGGRPAGVAHGAAAGCSARASRCSRSAPRRARSP